MHKAKQALGAFTLNQTFDGMGQIGKDAYEFRGHKSLALYVTGVGPANEITVNYRLKGMSEWFVLDTFTGPTTAAVFTKDTPYGTDELMFYCNSFDPGVGTPTLIVSGRLD